MAFQRRAWSRLRSATPAGALPGGAPAEARERFAAGIPLLASARPSFAGDPPLELVEDLARLAREAFSADGARVLERACRRNPAAVRDALEAALRRDAPALERAAERIGAPVELTASLCELAVSPSLRALAAGAAGLLAAAPWSSGYCPVCGSWPLLGEIRSADRSRYLRCGLCAAEWSFGRSACPYCGERDHRRLTALSVEGEEEYRRAELCDGCRGYVKSLARLTPIPPELLPVEDLATAYLDVLALDEGYAKPAAPPVFAEAVAAPSGFSAAGSPATLPRQEPAAADGRPNATA